MATQLLHAVRADFSLLCVCECQLELLSAKYLIGANLNGASDPYAVISCGDQKRFRWLAYSLPSLALAQSYSE
jgi:hypothetical protein